MNKLVCAAACGAAFVLWICAVPAWAQAVAAGSCPSGCNPLRQIRVVPVAKNSDTEVDVSWEVAALPSTMRIKEFLIIATPQSGNARQENVKVGPSLRSTKIIMRGMKPRDTLRVTVHTTFEINQTVIPSIRSKQLVQDGRKVFVDVEWGDVGNLDDCAFAGFEINASARTDKGHVISGTATAGRTERRKRVELTDGRDGINPTFVSTEAKVKTVDRFSSASTCSVNSGTLTVFTNGLINEIEPLRDQARKSVKVLEVQQLAGRTVRIKYQFNEAEGVKARNARVVLLPKLTEGVAAPLTQTINAQGKAGQAILSDAFSVPEFPPNANGRKPGVQNFVADVTIEFEDVEGSFKGTGVLTVSANGNFVNVATGTGGGGQPGASASTSSNNVAKPSTAGNNAKPPTNKVGKAKP